MADRVDTLDVFSGKDYLVRRLFCVSDGTGETNVVKVSKASLVNTLGAAPSKIGIEQVWWSINGFTSVEIDWDHTTDDEALVLATGNGALIYGMTPGLSAGVLWDPASAGGTGDILFTSRGAVNNASYNITLFLRLSGS